MNIVLQYPTWFIGLCLAVGFLYASVLYYKDNSFGEASSWLIWLLAAFRGTTVSIICLLLLSPVMRSTITESKPPIVILAQDNSESIGTEMSEQEQKEYASKMKALEENLAGKYDLKTYNFGEEVRSEISFDYTDKSTNISEFMREIYDTYSNQNLGAVILASDGIYNQGSSPVYVGSKINVPIFSIALGDTVPKKDLLLKKVYNNQIAYLGDRFSIQVDIAAINCMNNTSKLTVSKKGKKLVEKLVTIDNNDFFSTEELILEADAAGVQKYTVSLSPISQEVTTENNKKQIYIDVLDARQKILLLAESPHPDIAAFGRTIASNKNYEFDIAYAGKFKESIAKYDLVFLHQLPSKNNGITDIINTLKTKRIPHIYVLGQQIDINAFNSYQSLVNLTVTQDKTNDVEGLLTPDFNVFTLNDRIGENIFKFPPITTPFFSQSTVAPNAKVVLTQKIGSISTDYPLLVLGEENGVKQLILVGEGWWKWRLFDYMQDQKHEIFDELFGKLIQYVSNKEDKRRFRAFASNNIYNENEAITLDAELYNANYERVNEPEVRVEITNSEGKKYPFTFTKTNTAYTLGAKLFPVGDYRFEAETIYNKERLSAGGKFSVKPIQLEVFSTTADHQLLTLLSQRSGGKVLAKTEIDKLSAMIKAVGTAKPQIFSTVRTRSLIHLKWIFFLLLTLLSLEWFLRRYFGSY